MAQVIRTTFKFRRNLASYWEEKNPVLAEGEPCFELDTGKLKIGNGSDAYNNLPYLNADIATNDDAMDFLAEMGMITPVTNSSGEILISTSNEIYSL